MVGDAKFSEAQDFSSLKLWSGFFFFLEVVSFLLF